ncbi:MAG TPA: AMP-binding protein [Bacteroidales bacterium]|nr:AMP-binding protein [Bacteroidales bacterium]HPT01060.1 AMP-binding protein [Bacteroidales bacterium]
MKDSLSLTFPGFFAQTAERFGDRPAISLIGENPLTYAELDDKIKSLMAWLEALGVKQGDKMAILSISIPNWAVSYLAVTFMGAVAVPVLPDFHPDEITNILVHSGAKGIFVSDGLRSKIENTGNDELIKIRIEDYSLFNGEAPAGLFTPGVIPQGHYAISPDDLAAIIYTSGTTGNPKGVMLTHRNICYNAIQCSTVHPINENDRFLSILPLSHTYENTIGLIYPLMRGASIHYLGKAPSPSLLLPALKIVRPTAMLSVPLIIEKIFRNKIQPEFRKNIFLRIAVHIPFIRKKLNVVAGRKLMSTFGDELRFFGIGGSKLNKTVEKFLIEARFPYAIGYGLTETSPLLAGTSPGHFRLQSTGPAIEGVELSIFKPDPKTGEGEIWARGANVMKGYYKEPGLTEEVMTPDGWFRTGDLGVFDRDGYLFIKGRSKNMIVRAGGENIYPEEIESIINNFRHVIDCLVLDQKGKLVALVQFNTDEIAERNKYLKDEIKDYVEHKIEELRLELQLYVNHRVNKFSQIQVVIVQQEPFEKTATQKIKRYLYR